MGGVAKGGGRMCASVMEAAGRETVLIETVGVGQDEVDVVWLADVTVLVLVPGMGDEVQSLKAGVMEVGGYVCGEQERLRGGGLVEAEIVAMQGLVASEGIGCSR